LLKISVMGGSIIIEIGGPIASAELVGDEERTEEWGETGDSGERARAELESEKGRLRSVCETLQQVTDKLSEMYAKGISEQRAGIAKLAVEIAGKILRRKTEEGDYEIIKIVEEALKEASAKEEVTVRLNAQDLEQCKKVQEEGEVKFSQVTFVADAGLGRAECRVDTKRGIIAAQIEEQLERVVKALLRTG